MPAETKRVGVQVGGNATGFNSAIMGAQSKLSGFKKAALGMTAAVGAATVAMGAKSVTAAADFQGAMTESLAIMDDVSDSMRNEMADAAREVGRTTQFSATQAAESYFYLASAGLDAAESEQVLGDMAKFAQAGQFDMAKATDIATDANSALGREIENVNGVMNKLVKGNEMANATVEQFGEAITTKAGGAMNRFNVSLDEGVAVLAQFADTGLKGRRAGTIFARTIGGLARRARENAAIFEKMNIEVFNSQGEMRNLTDIIADMETAFEGMSTAEREAALAKMGFNERAMNGLNRLLGNSEALKEYEKQSKNAGDAIDRVASKQMEHFNAQMGLLGDNINDVFIGLGNKFLPSLTDLVKNGLIPTTRNLSKIVDESDGFIDFLDRASEQWLPGMNAEFKRLWSEGGGNFIGMIRQVGREQPAFQGALNAVAGGIETVVNWFNRVDWQHQKEQALNMAGDIGQEFKGLGQTVSDTLGNITGFEPKGSIDFEWDISTGLGEALRQEFGIGQQASGTAAAGIRSAVFAFVTAGTNNVFLGTLAATVGVNLAAEPTVKFAKDLKTAVMSSKSASELKEQGLNFEDLIVSVWPVIKFARGIKKAVKAEDTWQTLKEVDMPGKLDLIIDPVIGFAQDLAKAAKSSQPVEQFQELKLPGIDVTIDPVIEFSQDLTKAAKSKQTVKDLVEVGIEHPVKLTLGLAGAGAGIWWAAGKAAAAAKGTAGLISGITSTLATPLGLGALAATVTIGITVLDKKIKSEETEYNDFAGWAEHTFDTEMPDSMEHKVNEVWLLAKQVSLKQIFQDISDAWETWENEGPPWSNINWSETFHPPDWAQDINWGEIPWMDIINPFQEDDWPDVVSEWPGWDTVAKIGSLGKSAWKSYVGWPGWKTLDDWIFPEWGELADIDSVNWKTFTTFEGWANLLESATWPGWDKLFPELASVDWQKWTTFSGWADYLGEVNWPGWKELFGISGVNWKKYTTFAGWQSIVGEFDKWPGWEWANVGPLKLGDWVEIAWNKAAEKWPGWKTVIGTIDPLNLRGKIKKVAKSGWKEIINWQGWEIAGIDQVDWKQYTTFKGWKQYIDEKWQGWKELFGIEEINWASLTTFDGWQTLISDAEWPGWQALFPTLSKVDWAKFASFDGWNEIFADVQWPGWSNWIDPVGNWTDLIGWDSWKTIFPEWPGWGKFMNLTPQINFGIDVPELPGWLEWLFNNAKGAFAAAVNRVWGGGGNNNSENGQGHQEGTPWTGSGPRNEVAGFVHHQEAVIPTNVLKGGPGPILEFLGYNPGQGSLNAESGQVAGKLDKIEKNTAQVVEKLNAVAGAGGGEVNVEVQGVVSLEDVLAAITEEWTDERRAVGRG